MKMLVRGNDDCSELRLFEELAEIKRHEVRADCICHEFRARWISLGQTDPVNLRMTCCQLAADQAHASGAHDAQTDTLCVFLHRGSSYAAAAAARDSGRGSFTGSFRS